jgi:hypothetical protein
MKNLTLRVDEATLDRARKLAASRDTSVNDLVRGFLDDFVRQQDRREIARKELLELFRNSKADSGGRTWSRDELHER